MDPLCKKKLEHICLMHSKFRKMLRLTLSLRCLTATCRWFSGSFPPLFFPALSYYSFRRPLILLYLLCSFLPTKNNRLVVTGDYIRCPQTTRWVFARFVPEIIRLYLGCILGATQPLQWTSWLINRSTSGYRWLKPVPTNPSVDFRLVC